MRHAAASVKTAQLLVAASESSADMLHATGFRAPDAFVFLKKNGRTELLLSDLELDRGRREARVDAVHSYSQWEKAVQGRRQAKPALARVVAAFLRERQVRSVRVPGDFPLGLARELEKEGLILRAGKGSFFPERETKSPQEIRAVEAALRLTEAGLARAMEILRASRIGRAQSLRWRGRLLTAEILRQEMEVAVVRAGGEARGETIVACGEQACDPHERGFGPLRAHQLLILDLFPRDARSGYFGDMTRTVVRGRASNEQRRLWNTCLQGQKMALQAMKPGASGKEIHQSIKAFFTRRGWPTIIQEGRWQGFFHGTGHGLGLEIHENPRFAATTFQPGQILTVEPGIYIPGLGGVRHEDVVVITPKGRRILSRFPKELEIRTARD